MNKMINQQQLVTLKEKEQQQLLEWSKQNDKPEYKQAAEDIATIVNNRAQSKKTHAISQ